MTVIRNVSVFLDPMLTIAAAVVVGGVAIARRRATRRRFYADVLRRLPPILEATPPELAILLGTSLPTLRRWDADGVPEVSQGDITRLLRTAVGLRDCLGPSVARHLLLLRQRRISDTAGDYRALLANPRKRPYSPKRAIITVR